MKSDVALVSPKWRDPSPLALTYFAAKASACTTAVSDQAPRLLLACGVVPLAHLLCRHNTRPRSITFALQGRGSSLGDSPSLTLAVEEAPSPPAFWASPSVIITSGRCSGFLCSQRGFLLTFLSGRCSQMGTWDHHPFLMIGAPHPHPGNQWRPHG